MDVKLINGFEWQSLDHQEKTQSEMIVESKKLLASHLKRRTVREISSKAVPLEILENIIMTASSAPSGANKQPWTFCLIGNPEVKRKIRQAAEEEEKENYSGRMSDDWLEDLKKFGTNWEKPFLTEAPWLIVVFKEIYQKDEKGSKHKNYYVNESVGIACGMLISAIHQAGLVSVTHTPSPMNFLSKVLGRPENERAYLLVPVGYPKENTFVPVVNKKKKSSVIQYFL